MIGAGGKVWSASETKRQIKEDLMAETRTNEATKVESDEKLVSFFFDKPEGKRVHVDLEKELKGEDEFLTPLLSTNKSEEEGFSNKG